MYQIGICSRDKTTIETVEDFILEKYQIKVNKYLTEIEFSRNVEDRKDFIDILIIDIQWSKNSISLAKDIQKENIEIKIIFIVENIYDVIDIFEVEPIYLLLKPLERQRLYFAIDKAILKIGKHKNQLLKLWFKDKLICIPYQEIFFIESDLRYLIIHQKNKTDRIMMKMSEIMERLPENFIRCHQSYLVNVHQMARFEKYNIVMKDGSNIAVSRNRFEEAKNAIEKYYKMNRKDK